ncbi:MAG: hypothetical protein NDI90_21745 [Nitrospira sp. BO4]|jgi:hypothetical protein|nr:hypothetical protein [Nitrospira sp. BO4]
MENIKAKDQTKHLTTKIWTAVFPDEARAAEETQVLQEKEKVRRRKFQEKLSNRSNHSLKFFDQLADTFHDKRIGEFGWNRTAPDIKTITDPERDLHLNLWTRGELNTAKRWLYGAITSLIRKRRKSEKECSLLRVRKVQLVYIQDAMIDYQYVHQRLKKVRRRVYRGSEILKKQKARRLRQVRKADIKAALERSKAELKKT